MMSEFAVVLDVAGTLLRMYRVANDLINRRLMERIVTAQLVMERAGRALVVPQLNPKDIERCPEDMHLLHLIETYSEGIEISCYSTPVDTEKVLEAIRCSDAKVEDLVVAQMAVRRRCPETYCTTGIITDTIDVRVPYIVSTGGVPFPGLKSVFDELKSLGFDIYLASGDSARSLVHLVDYGIDPENIYSVADPLRKKYIVNKLKEDHRFVVMVGDGLNDLYALEAADLSVLTVQQNPNPHPRLVETTDVIINNIRQLPKVVKYTVAGMNH